MLKNQLVVDNPKRGDLSNDLKKAGQWNLLDKRRYKKEPDAFRWVFLRHDTELMRVLKNFLDLIYDKIL